MRKKLGILALVFWMLIGTALATGNTTVSYAVTGGNLYFDTDTGTITGCDTGVTVANIPYAIQDVPVTKIGSFAFYDCAELKNISIPESVTEIEFGAFAGCDNLSSITIPASVTKIETGGQNTQIFDCANLQSINVASENTTYQSIDGVLYTKDATTLVFYPQGKKDSNFAIPDSVTCIGESAFLTASNLCTLSIPDSVNKIKYAALANLSENATIIFAGTRNEWESMENEYEKIVGYPSVMTPATVYCKDDNMTKLPFQDITSSAYRNAIQYVYENGLMNGTSDTTFGPNGYLTRAMMVTILYRLAGTPEIAGEDAFSDVTTGQWYTASVQWATKSGLATGYSDGKFRPDSYVTREQLAVFLYRYAQTCGYNPSSSLNILNFYQDAATVHSYATLAVKWAVENEILCSSFNEYLTPTASATREEVAQALMAFCEYIAGEK